MSSGGGRDDELCLTGSYTEEVLHDLEPWDEHNHRQEWKRRRLLREFPDLEEEESPFAVWEWSLPQRRRIVRKAHEEVMRQQTIDALAITRKGMDASTTMPRVWQIVFASGLL